MSNFKNNGGNKNRQSNNNNGNSNNRQKPAYDPNNYVKRSGCDMVDSYTHKAGENKGKDSGTPCIWGWKVATGGAGLLKFVAVMNHKPETKKERWLKFVVTITPPNGVKFLTTGFWDNDKGRLHMPDMDLIANPAKSYFGRNFKSKK